jgi:hypothetical protein
VADVHAVTASTYATARNTLSVGISKRRAYNPEHARWWTWIYRMSSKFPPGDAPGTVAMQCLSLPVQTDWPHSEPMFERACGGKRSALRRGFSIPRTQHSRVVPEVVGSPTVRGHGRSENLEADRDGRTKETHGLARPRRGPFQAL